MKEPFDHKGNSFEPTKAWQPLAFMGLILVSMAAVVALLLTSVALVR